jgi:hypothetical protein
MGKTRKVLTAEELVVKQEADYLKKQKANLAWRQNNPENYEYFKTTYMKKYYEENKERLNAQTKERRRKKKLEEAEVKKALSASGKGVHGTCSLLTTNSEGDSRSPDEFVPTPEDPMV